jgi:integrase
MGRRTKGTPPAMRRHRAKGLAYVYDAGRQVYLGTWNAPETRRAYAKFVASWEASQASPDAAAATVGDSATILTVGALFAEFLRFAEKHHHAAGGKRSSQYRLYVWFSKPFLTLYCSRRLNDFRPRDVRAFLDKLEVSGQVSRDTLNTVLRRLKRIFAWGVEREHCDPSVSAAIFAMKPVAKGRTTAADRPPVTSAPLRSIVAAIRELRTNHPSAVARILTQYYSGARPGEVCAMRLGELHTSGTVTIPALSATFRVPAGVWLFVPQAHKTAHRGGVIVYAFGERVQSVLAPYIAEARAYAEANGLAAADVHLFRSSYRADYINSPIQVQTYGEQIAEAIRQAKENGVACVQWAPNRLRHNFATRVSAATDLDTASRALNHVHTATTARYVDRSIKHATDVALRFAASRNTNATKRHE